ncbi:hypothetical protein MHYP_G00051050 [Metynnis hypsauchen]
MSCSPLSKKVVDGTKTRKVKTDHLLRVEDHDFTMRPAFAVSVKAPVTVRDEYLLHSEERLESRSDSIRKKASSYCQLLFFKRCCAMHRAPLMKAPYQGCSERAGGAVISAKGRMPAGGLGTGRKIAGTQPPNPIGEKALLSPCAP